AQAAGPACSCGRARFRGVIACDCACDRRRWREVDVCSLGDKLVERAEQVSIPVEAELTDALECRPRALDAPMISACQRRRPARLLDDWRPTPRAGARSPRGRARDAPGASAAERDPRP